MHDRTEPSDAIERIAWTLNYHEGESVSVNRLAEKTGLSWATTKKYAQTLEVLGRIAPTIEVTSEGIVVGATGDNFGSLSQERDLLLAIYVLHHAGIEEGTDDSIDASRHADVLETYDSTLEELEDAGWLERTDDTVRITPEGAAIAGPARSRLRNSTLEDGGTTAEIEVGRRSSVDDQDQERATDR